MRVLENNRSPKLTAANLPRLMLREFGALTSSWVQGDSFAVSFPVINAMWLEPNEPDTGERAGDAGAAGRAERG